jgi:hypothetical protein
MFVAPPYLRTERPFRLTMQIFPDGRGGVALDTVVIWSGPLASWEPTMHVMLDGNSVDTRVLVGRLKVGPGIASGVEWH